MPHRKLPKKFKGIKLLSQVLFSRRLFQKHGG
jgi:hypothetical protein